MATVDSSLQTEQVRLQSPVHMPALDGIRGLAVLMVVAVHYVNLSNSTSPLLKGIGFLVSGGWAGVEVFFVLSGFLITGILWDKKDQPHRLKNFYTRRVLRLFPVYYGVWALLLLYMVWTHQPWSNRYLAYLLYCGNIAGISSVGIFLVNHFWTLAVEEQFYIVWPLVLWRLDRLWLAMRVLLGAALLSIALKPILILMHRGYLGPVLLPSHMEGLALGSFLALASRTPSAARYLNPMGKFLPLFLAAILGLMVRFHGLPNDDVVLHAYAVPLLSVASMLLIWNCLIPGSIYQRLMELPFLRFYGKYSYGLYVYHFLLRRPFSIYVYHPLASRIHSSALLVPVYMAIVILLLTLLSVASFHFYESPFLRLKSRF